MIINNYIVVSLNYLGTCRYPVCSASGYFIFYFPEKIKDIESLKDEIYVYRDKAYDSVWKQIDFLKSNGEVIPKN